MKLEVGKYYKTRDGRKAFVRAVTLPNPFVTHIQIYPVQVCFENGEEYSYTSEGGYSISGPSGNDLIPERKELIRVSGWVNVSHSGDSEKITRVYVEGVEE